MIKPLEKEFQGTGDVKGSLFEQIAFNDRAFVYEVTPPDAKCHYEVFLRKTIPLCIDFENRVYSETDLKEMYPKSKDFGVWAWCISNKQKAIDKFKSLNDE